MEVLSLAISMDSMLIQAKATELPVLDFQMESTPPHHSPSELSISAVSQPTPTSKLHLITSITLLSKHSLLSLSTLSSTSKTNSTKLSIDHTSPTSITLTQSISTIQEEVQAVSRQMQVPWVLQPTCLGV